MKVLLACRTKDGMYFDFLFMICRRTDAWTVGGRGASKNPSKSLSALLEVDFNYCFAFSMHKTGKMDQNGTLFVFLFNRTSFTTKKVFFKLLPFLEIDCLLSV